MHPKSLNPVFPYESTIPTYMQYFRAILRKFVCAISNFQNKFLFCVLIPLMSGSGWPIFSLLDMLFSRWVFIHLSLHKSVAVNRDAQSRNEIKYYDNKFLVNCWYGRHVWIRLAMDCERMVEKGIHFILCLGTAYDLASMESIGNSWSFSLTGKACHSKQFYLSI